MRRAAAVLVMALCGAVGWGQDAPSQSGPVPGGPPDYPGAADGTPARGYAMESGMTAPKIVQAVAAVYPADASVEGNGHCMLSMTIDQNGMPLFIHLVHSAGEAYDSAAIYAVRQSKFEAGLREGKPVPIRIAVRVAFTADRAPAVPEILKPSYRGTGDSVRADYPPKVTHRGEVEFSEEARKKRINGSVLVSLLVTEEGLPAEVHVVRGMGYGMDEKAMEAVRQYRFQPAMKDGKPIAQHISIEVNFQIF